MSDFSVRDETIGTTTFPEEESTGILNDSEDVESAFSRPFNETESDPLAMASTGLDQLKSPSMMSSTTEAMSDGIGSYAPPTALTTTNAASNGSTNGTSELHLSDIKQSASDAATQAKQQAGQMIGQAKDAAGQALAQARDQVKSQLGQQKDRAAGSLNGLTHSAHEVGDTLRRNNLPQAADATEALAGHVDRIADYLKSSEIDDLARDAERFARENPAVVLAGALVVGVLIGRFFRASSRTTTATNGSTPMLTDSRNSNGYGMARQDRFDDESIARGQKPLTANGYVPGGILGGAPA